MPEMPELEVVRRRLGPRLAGRGIAEVAVSPKLGFLLRASTAQLKALAGGTAGELRRRGKWLVLDVDGDGDSAHLVINPMLGGRFQWADPGEKVTAATVFQVVLDDGDELRYTDTARMGRVYLAQGDDWSQVHGFADMGPEAVDITPDDFAARIRRHPGELKNLLRNQSFIAGVGNAYSDEILHHAGLLPLRRRSTLTPDDVTRLHASTRRVLLEAVAAIEAQPDWLSHKQDRSFMQVHMKGGQPCPRCGHRISELTARGEITNFCRGCQV